MVQLLVLIGLVVIPFAHIEHVMDQSQLKEYLALGLALAVAFYTLYRDSIKPLENKWLLFSILAMVASTAFVPPSGLVLGVVDKTNAFAYSNINIENLWNFKPICLSIIYLLFASAIASSYIDAKKVVTCIAWVGFLMALVVLFQKLGFQQFWRIQGTDEIKAMRYPEIMGFMAQYTLVAAFMGITQVAMLMQKRWWFLAITTIAIIITSSKFGYASIPLAWGLWYFIEGKINVTKVTVTAVIFISALILFGKYNDGRFLVWSQIYHDITHPLFDNALAQSQGFTGFGAGAFGVFFPILHKSGWGKAHNEFLEFLFNNGIFGFTLLSISIFTILQQCYKIRFDDMARFCLVSLLVTIFFANGTFIWQLGWGQFYTAVFVGLAYSSIRKNYLIGVENGLA